MALGVALMSSSGLDGHAVALMDFLVQTDIEYLALAAALIRARGFASCIDQLSVPGRRAALQLAVSLQSSLVLTDLGNLALAVALVDTSVQRDMQYVPVASAVASTNLLVQTVFSVWLEQLLLGARWFRQMTSSVALAIVLVIWTNI